MKERTSFTFDKETLKIIDELSNSGTYRNKSHFIEYSIRLFDAEMKREVLNERAS
jgi:Arc/MetJ-type ribon-helix-helix transcriptional regulator